MNIFKLCFLLICLLAAGCAQIGKSSSAQFTPVEPQTIAAASNGAESLSGATDNKLLEQKDPDDNQDQEAVEQNVSEKELNKLARQPLSIQEEQALQSESKIKFDLDVQETEKVKLYFRYFAHKHKKTFARWLDRARPYLPRMRQIFKQKGLPEDLIFIPFAESGFNPWAYSRMGAGGMWQFMPTTGRRQGLRIDWWLDERRDPYKSTEAAADYLKYLYEQFEDWNLALAAYNAGEGSVRKAIKKGKTRNFFKLTKTKQHFGRETRHYVPKFLAILKIARNLEKLGFKPFDMSLETSVASIKLYGRTDLHKLAKTCNLDWKHFTRLNPAFRRSIAPGDQQCSVYLPSSKLALAQKFLENFPKTVQVAGVKRYKVRSGDSWWRIARRYGLTIAELKEINNTRRNSLRPGQWVLIAAEESDGNTGAGLVSTPAATRKKIAQRRANYTVKNGESLWRIARRFNTSVKTLLAANGLSNGSQIKVGQKLYIPDSSGQATRMARTDVAQARTKLVRYNVRPGDTLWEIARRFKVSTQQLQAWNKLGRRSTLHPGKRLVVYVR